MKNPLSLFVSAVIFFSLSSSFNGCATPANLREETAAGLKYFAIIPERKNKSEIFPVIWVFPGQGMNTAAYAKMWEPFARKNRVATVILNWEFWTPQNVGAGQENNRSEAFESVAEELKIALPLDEKQMYLCGLSSGAGLANHVAKIKPEKWKGVVWISFTTSDFNAQIGKPEHFPPLLIIHGQKAEQFTYTQAVEDIRRLRDAGISIEWFEDPAGGHEHRPEWTPKIFDWIQRDEGAANP